MFSKAQRRVQRQIIASLVIAAPLLVSIAPSQGEALATPKKTATYVVRYKNNVNIATVLGAEFRRGLKPTAIYTTLFPGFSARLTPANWKRYKSDKRVSSISEIKSYSVPKTATIRNASYVWGLDRLDQPNLPLNSTFSSQYSGAGVTAYIIDSGTDSSHQEFGSRVQPGFSAVYGYSATSDCSGHGTHVAGTVGGRNVGVAPGVSIVPVRVFGCAKSTTTATILKGIEFVIGHHQPGNPAVANLSLGGSLDPALDYGIRMLVADGISVSVAAGNSSVNACNVSPAREPQAITVGATTQSDIRASYSNFGKCLDVFAPGSEILSAWPSGRYALLNGTSMASPHVAGVAALHLQANPSLSPAQVQLNIRNQATPGVLGSIGTGSPNSLVYSGSIQSPPLPGTPTTSTPSTTTSTTLPPTIPGAVTSLTAQGSSGSAFVVWNSPASNGGARINDYKVEYRLSTNISWTTFNDGISTSTAALVNGLTDGNQYDFRISAINSVGVGPTQTVSSVPVGVSPSRPMITASTFKNPWSQSPVSSLALDQSGGQVAFTLGLQASGYLPSGSDTVQGQLCPAASTYPSGSGCTGSLFPYASGNSTNATYGALFILGNSAPGGTYVVTFDISMTNGSTYRIVVPTTIEVSAFTPTVPSAPYGIQAVAGSTSVSLSWSAPTSNGGYAITDYVIDVWAKGGSSYSRFVDGVSTSTSATVTGLSSNTYSFRVAAVNAVGTGSWLNSGDIVVKSVTSSITSDKYTRTVGGASVSSITIASSGFTWVYYEVNLSDTAGLLPTSMGGQLCPIAATYPDFNLCTGATFGRQGTGYSAKYVGLFGFSPGVTRGQWKSTFDVASRIESPRRLTVN